MEIKFSRHAIRRMQLYKIGQEDVIQTLNRQNVSLTSQQPWYEIVNEELSKQYGYPLKIVYSKENDKIVVITAYPLKKERQR